MIICYTLLKLRYNNIYVKYDLFLNYLTVQIPNSVLNILYLLDNVWLKMFSLKILRILCNFFKKNYYNII